ncbi:MAG TPA: helix-turn-helix transcriptional regulator [Rhizomicrobium sp.]
MSPSGLAKIAGLDPTTFNKSKRGTANGKLRWPSTESLAKVLSATGATLDDFVALVSDVGASPARARMVPLIGMAQAGTAGYFDDAGFPAGSGWEDIAFPEIADEHCYALEITGDSMLPVYRDGDRIVVSPSGNLRRGDRVVVKTHTGEVMAKQLGRLTAQRIELRSFNPSFEDRSFALSEIAFVHRIIWASQ